MTDDEQQQGIGGEDIELNDITDDESREVALGAAGNVKSNISKHATKAPELKMNDSKHAPAELKPSQRQAAEAVDNQYAEGVDQRTEEENTTSMGGCEERDKDENKGTERKAEGKKENEWDVIMGQPGWREKEEEPQIHMWFNMVRNMIGEVKAVQEKRNVGQGKMETGQGNRLWERCKEVVALMVTMMKLMAESNLETDWKDVDGMQRAAILEWARQRGENEERSIRKELLEPIAQGVCVLVAEKPGASLKQVRLANQHRKRAEEERKAEEKKRRADKGMSAARKGIAKMEEEKKAEEEGVAKARAQVQQNGIRVNFLNERLTTISQEMPKAEGDEKLRIVEEMGKIGEEIKACQASSADFSGKTRQFCNGVEFKSGRLIATVDTSVKGGEKARGEIRTKTNELLRSIPRSDGATPFAEIDKVEERVGWNGEKEIVLTMSKVNKQETVTRIREVMVAQLNAVCGNGVLRAHREPAFPAAIIVRGVPEDLEGSELVQIIRSENPGVNVTPRWPHRYLKSKTVRFEVESPVEAERVAKMKKVTIRGESLEASAYDPEGWRRSKTAQSTPPTAATYANMARPGGWRGPGNRALSPNTEKLNTYQAAGVAERKGPRCYNCEGIGHVSSVCPNKKMQRKGTSIFAKHGCYNCGKEGHHQDRCPSPRRFCSRCCVLGHVLEECRVEKAVRRQKREGEELTNPRPAREPPSPDGFINVIKRGAFRKGRLSETDGRTVSSESTKNGTASPPPTPPTGPAGARNPI